VKILTQNESKMKRYIVKENEHQHGGLLELEIDIIPSNVSFFFV